MAWRLRWLGGGLRSTSALVIIVAVVAIKFIRVYNKILQNKFFVLAFIKPGIRTVA